MTLLKGKQIGVALTGSHCTIDSILPQLKKMVQAGADLFPIISPTVQRTDTRFGTAGAVRQKIEQITGRKPWLTMVEVEPIGPKKLLDLLLIAPCSGNSMAKLARGITDNAVLMAAKAQLRNGRPLLLAISTNDALGLNAGNLAILLNAKNIYLVPFGQDNPDGKPNSMLARPELIIPAVEAALTGRQLQPLLVSPV